MLDDNEALRLYRFPTLLFPHFLEIGRYSSWRIGAKMRQSVAIRANHITFSDFSAEFACAD